jgi:hypothetical protein
MVKHLTIKIDREDIRASIKDAWADSMISRTPTKSEIDGCIEWLKEEYAKDYSGFVTTFVNNSMF